MVFFPHAVQSLHIFEPRYCDMLQDALAHDRLIAMVLLEPGWELQYQSRPAIAHTTCIGKIISHTPTDDQRHNILLAGVKRARIIRELEPHRSFREADVEVLEDQYPTDAAQHRPELAQRLQSLFQQFIPQELAAQESFRQLVGEQLPLGVLADTIAYALRLPLAIKQQLLAEANVDVRCRLLSRCLEQKLQSLAADAEDDFGGEFPPRFSTN